MRRRTLPAESAHREYSVNEAAQLLALSRWTVTRMFEHEPGVRIYGNEKSTRNRRRQRTLRIPEYVLRRVQERHSVSKRFAAPSPTKSSRPAKEHDFRRSSTSSKPKINAISPFSSETHRIEPVPAGAVSDEVLKQILDEKLRPLHQEILELSRGTGGAMPDSLDPRKEFVAEIVKSRPPFPKMSVPVIFSEADKRQNQFPKKAHFRPPPAWKVRFWSDMKSKNKAQAWIAKVRGDPRYLPFDYLTKRGKARFMKRERP
jgi:hypothetical protein